MDRKDYVLTAQNMLFHGVDLVSVEYMLEHCSVRDLAADEVLLQPDIPNHHLYLILEGELVVHLAAREKMQYTTLIAGDCAGDISLIDGKPPSALVVAARPTRVMGIPQDTVWSLVNQSHGVARNLLEIVARRMRNDNRALITSQNMRMQFERQANFDALTGVHNRHWMSEAFPRALQRCARDKQPSAIMIVDIDFFKRVNDTHGHLVGDSTLREVAGSMAKNLRPFDMLVRYGGEEFAILLSNTSTEDVRMVAERLRNLIAESKIQHDEISFNVTISIGVALAQGEKTLETLLGEADKALYRAKEAGRNRVEVFSQE